MPGFDPLVDLLYQFAVPMSTETEPISQDELSDKPLYEIAAQLSDEE